MDAEGGVILSQQLIYRLCKYFPGLLLEPLYYRDLTALSDLNLLLFGAWLAELCDGSCSAFKNINGSVFWAKSATLMRAFFRGRRRHPSCSGLVVPATAVVLLSKDFVG